MYGTTLQASLTCITGGVALLCAMALVPTASLARNPGGREACEAHSGNRPGEPEPAAEALALHNAERARLSLPPLAWSCHLAQEAAGWARMLAQRGRLEHASKDVRGASGENLWMGTAGRFAVAHMVGRFVEEREVYRHARFPDISRTGNWKDAGHYSQLVWRDTSELGCALASGSGRDVLVCRYHPAGNVEGRLAF